jgi:hypothetical protein
MLWIISEKVKVFALIGSMTRKRRVRTAIIKYLMLFLRKDIFQIHTSNISPLQYLSLFIPRLWTQFLYTSLTWTQLTQPSQANNTTSSPSRPTQPKTTNNNTISSTQRAPPPTPPPNNKKTLSQSQVSKDNNKKAISIRKQDPYSKRKTLKMKRLPTERREIRRARRKIEGIDRGKIKTIIILLLDDFN